MAVYNYVPRTVLPAQNRIVCLFNTAFANYIAGLVIGKARVVQVFFAYLAHVPDQVRCEAVAGIKPALLINRLQLRQFVAMRLDESLLVCGDVLFDRDGLVARCCAIALDRRLQLVQIKV